MNLVFAFISLKKKCFGCKLKPAPFFKLVFTSVFFKRSKAGVNVDGSGNKD